MAMRQLPGVIMPFPGGIVRSGSKVGSKYKKLVASTNDAYCPTLKAESRARSCRPRSNRCSRSSSTGSPRPTWPHATAVGVRAACGPGRKGGIVAISAGNYGGNLGPYHFHLRKVLA